MRSHTTAGRPPKRQTPDRATSSVAVRPERLDAPGDLLTLQRSAGNQAVVARLKNAPGTINTGLRRKTRTDAFGKVGHDYWADPANKDKTLADYANKLIDEANAVLKTMSSFEVKRAFSTTGPDSGTFSRVTWTITINTAKFSNRTGVSKVSDLTLDEAAEIADTIYHEVRHSEQYFRIARVRAAESKKKKKADIATELVADMSIPKDVAEAAAADPLKKSKDVMYRIGEAKDWESITIGLHAEYKGIINTWGDEADEARNSALAVTRGTVRKTRDDIKTHMDDWSTNPSRNAFVDSHLAKVQALKKKSRMDTLVIEHLTAIKAALGSTGKAWKKVTDNWASDRTSKRLKRLQGTQDPLKTLASELYKAYRDHLHEKDAWETGAAVGAAFRKLGAPAPTGGAGGH